MSETPRDGGRRERHASGGVSLSVPYGVVTLAYLAGITWLSSIPRQPSVQPHAVVEVSLNMLHVPLFGGLAFCLLKTMGSGLNGRAATGWLCAAALPFLTAFAALNEWQQGFVPGRSCSMSDFLLDMAGIGAVLLIFLLDALLGAMAPDAAKVKKS